LTLDLIFFKEILIISIILIILMNDAIWIILIV